MTLQSEIASNVGGIEPSHAYARGRSALARGYDEGSQQIAAANDASRSIAGLVVARIVPADDRAMAILGLKQPTDRFDPAKDAARAVAKRIGPLAFDQ